jgi:hypothetical protein
MLIFYPDGGEIVSEETVKIILNMLNQINTKQDAQAAQLTQISERLATIETKQAAQDKINDKVSGLEEIKDKGMGAKTVIAWLIAMGLSLMALFKNSIR